MKYIIDRKNYGEIYWVALLINGNFYDGKTYYTTRRAAVRAAKKAGGTEEVK